MSLYLNSDNNTISIRRGDSGVLHLLFSKKMYDTTVTFSVKKNKDDEDEDAVITKTFKCGVDSYFSPYDAYFLINPEDTNELEVSPVRTKIDYQEYVWMVKIETYDGLLADTIIPEKTGQFPKFRIYYGSVPASER